MKTAMQQIIDRIDIFGIELTINDIKRQANELIEIEKQQIIDAHVHADKLANETFSGETLTSEEIDDCKRDAEKYYNETFNQ